MVNVHVRLLPYSGDVRIPFLRRSNKFSGKRMFILVASFAVIRMNRLPHQKWNVYMLHTLKD
jgi:hypothetical protein